MPFVLTSLFLSRSDPTSEGETTEGFTINQNKNIIRIYGVEPQQTSQ